MKDEKVESIIKNLAALPHDYIKYREDVTQKTIETFNKLDDTIRKALGDRLSEYSVDEELEYDATTGLVRYYFYDGDAKYEISIGTDIECLKSNTGDWEPMPEINLRLLEITWDEGLECNDVLEILYSGWIIDNKEVGFTGWHMSGCDHRELTESEYEHVKEATNSVYEKFRWLTEPIEDLPGTINRWKGYAV